MPAPGTAARSRTSRSRGPRPSHVQHGARARATDDVERLQHPVHALVLRERGHEDDAVRIALDPDVLCRTKDVERYAGWHDGDPARPGNPSARRWSRARLDGAHHEVRPEGAPRGLSDMGGMRYRGWCGEVLPGHHRLADVRAVPAHAGKLAGDERARAPGSRPTSYAAADRRCADAAGPPERAGLDEPLARDGGSGGRRAGCPRRVRVVRGDPDLGDGRARHPGEPVELTQGPLVGQPPPQDAAAELRGNTPARERSWTSPLRRPNAQTTLAMTTAPAQDEATGEEATRMTGVTAPQKSPDVFQNHAALTTAHPEVSHDGPAAHFPLGTFRGSPDPRLLRRCRRGRGPCRPSQPSPRRRQGGTAPPRLPCRRSPHGGIARRGRAAWCARAKGTGQDIVGVEVRRAIRTIRRVTRIPLGGGRAAPPR